MNREVIWKVGRNGPQMEFEGGEFFFSKDATSAIGVDNLSRINESVHAQICRWWTG
jgi:hypothetical protein